MQAKKYIVFGFIGLIVIVLVVLGVVLLRRSDEKTSTPESTNDSLEAIGLKCESVSSSSFGSLPLLLPELAEILERSHFCGLDADDIDVDAPYIRLSAEDYDAMLELLEGDFQKKLRSDDEIIRRMAPVIYDVCKNDSSYKMPGFRRIDAQGLLIGQHVFLGEGLASSDLAAGLKDQGVEYDFTESLCHSWSIEAADNQELSQTDSSPAQPVEEMSDVHQPSIDKDVLPTLPISSDEYEFLDGSQTKPSEQGGFFPDCWQIDYSIAFKGAWEIDTVDAVFTQAQLFEGIQSRIQQLYPDENPSGGFGIFLDVYEYNGKDTLVEPDTDPWIWNYDPDGGHRYSGPSCDIEGFKDI